MPVFLIHCDECWGTGALPLKVEYEYRRVNCTHCNHVESLTSVWSFCGLICFSEWILKRRKVNGALALPCKACGETGFALQHEENGPCSICGGSGQILVKDKQ